MTYGWAFLVILVMVGALAYFGVLNPSRLTPDKCIFEQPFQCSAGDLAMSNTDTSTIKLKAYSNFGKALNIYGATVSTDFENVCTAPNICFDNDNDGLCGAGDDDLDAATEAAPELWKSTEYKRIVIDCNNGNLLVEGDKVKFLLSFKYYTAGVSAAYSKDATAELYAEIQ